MTTVKESSADLQLVEFAQESLDALSVGCAACGAVYRLINTRQPIELVLRDYLLYRRRRSR